MKSNNRSMIAASEDDDRVDDGSLAQHNHLYKSNANISPDAVNLPKGAAASPTPGSANLQSSSSQATHPLQFLGHIKESSGPSESAGGATDHAVGGEDYDYQIYTKSSVMIGKNAQSQRTEIARRPQPSKTEGVNQRANVAEELAESRRRKTTALGDHKEN